MAGDTWLDDRNRRKAIEAAADEKFAVKFEDEVFRRFWGELAPIFSAHGVSLTDPSHSLAEQERVEIIIQRDRRERKEELDRKVAETEVDAGLFYNLTDTVVPPTPELLAKVDVAPYTPKQQDGTVRTVTTVRVIRTPIIARLWKAGKLSDDLARACLWYRMVHECAGLDGHWASSQWKGPDHVSSGTTQGIAAGHLPMTMLEAEARQEFRQAVIAIEPMYREFFNHIVIHDLPLRNAARFAKCRNNKVLSRFRDCAEDLLDHLEARKIELPSPHDWTRA